MGHTASVPSVLGRGALAGLGGTVVMTAFQKLVEMPLTGRRDSYAPAAFAEKLLPVDVDADSDRVNGVAHFALGAMMGAGHGLVFRAGMRGQKAVAVTFAAVYTGDLLLNTKLGLYEPGSWSKKDWAVDLVDKYIQAAATGAVFERVLTPAAQR